VQFGVGQQTMGSNYDLLEFSTQWVD